MVRLLRRFSFTIRPEAPYDFTLTVRKPAGWPLFTPAEESDGRTLWTALRIGGKLVGLKLRSAGVVESPRIEATAFLAGRPDAGTRDLVEKATASKLYCGESLSGFYRMARRDPVLKHAVRHRYGMQDTDAAGLFPSAILAVCLQMAPMERSDRMMDCLLRTYGDEAEFDGKRIAFWPSAAVLSRKDPRELAKRCKLGYRAKYIVGIAKAIERGFPTLDELKAMGPAEAKSKLMELPGIGDYSSDIISPHGGFPIDVWSADVFGKLFFGREPRSGRDEIERIKAEGIRRWGKWSWLAFLYVVQDLENLSKKLGVKLRLS